MSSHITYLNEIRLKEHFSVKRRSANPAAVFDALEVE